MSAKTYALWGGIILLVLGVLGFVMSGRVLGLNSDPLEDVFHVIAGALLAYAGYRGTDKQAAMWAKVFGIVFLVVGVAGFLSKNLFGLLPGGLTALDNIVHLIYGGLGAWAGMSYKGM